MKILLLSFYFEPDLCAGSFRNTSLFYKLKEKLGGAGEIHVITTMPNRYNSFKAEALAEEIGENYRISRIQIPEHKSGMLDQAKSFMVFYKETMKLIYDNDYDIVYASSSRLFTAFLGRRITIINKAFLYLDIRDIFVDTIKDVFRSKKILLYPLVFSLKLVEKYTFANADHINLVSEGFRSYFLQYKKPKYTYFTNGIDDVFLNIEPKTFEKYALKPYIITYAGNIGSGQGLEKVLPDAAAMLGEEYHFRIIGDGGTKPLLEKRIAELGLKNIDIIKPVSRDELICYYEQSTFLFFHLNDLEAFRKVLPSKLFEYGAFDKPIIAGVGGYAAEFVANYLSNYILFNPTDVNDFVEKLKKNTLIFKERREFKQKFKRTAITEEMVETILKFEQ